MTSSDSDENLFNISEDLAPPPTYKIATISSVDFNGLLQPPLQLAEDLKEGCGGQLWPAGMVLAKYLLRQPKNMFSDKTMFVGWHISRRLTRVKQKTNELCL